MKIIDILRCQRTISFEFFPPKEKDGIDHVLRVVDEVKTFEPSFVSVTYGAGGSTRALTEEITSRIKRDTNLEVMAHLTCVGQTKEEIHGVLERLNSDGIENIIALRGDPPRGEKSFSPVKGGFSHASDLIEYIRQRFSFGVAAACYPEGHIESPDLDSDISYTKLKVEKGAEFLISQLFYDNDDFFKFQERAKKNGILVPLIPGILPILSTSQIRRFTAMCGSKIPPPLDQQLTKFAGDDASVRELGIDHATRQIKELWDHGVPGIHFYVLNRSYSVSKILNNLEMMGRCLKF